MTYHEWSIEWKANVIALSSTVITIVGTLLCLTIKKLYFGSQPNGSNMHGPIKLLALSEMCSWLMAFTTLILMNTIFHENKKLLQLFYCLFALFCIFGCMSSYLFLVCRYYYVFIDSMFSMTRKAKYFHILTAISIPIYCLFGFYFWFYRHMTLFYLTGMTGIGLQCAAYLLLIYGFNHNLFEVMLKHRQQTLITVNNYKKPSLHEAVQSSSLNTHQLVMISTITKQTLLGCVQAFCLLFIVFGCILVLILRTIFPHVDRCVFLFIFAYSVVLTIIVGIICVYLGFMFNVKMYNFICSSCHWKCNAFCEALAEKRVEEELQMDKLRSKNNSSVSIVVNHQSTITPQSASFASITAAEKPTMKTQMEAKGEDVEITDVEDIEIQNFDIDENINNIKECVENAEKEP